jgi:hypothetical protein
VVLTCSSVVVLIFVEKNMTIFSLEQAFMQRRIFKYQILNTVISYLIVVFISQSILPSEAGSILAVVMFFLTFLVFIVNTAYHVISSSNSKLVVLGFTVPSIVFALLSYILSTDRILGNAACAIFLVNAVLGLFAFLRIRKSVLNSSDSLK